MSYFDDASLVMIPSGYKTSKVYSVKPTSGDGDLTFTRSNDTATRVASNGLIEKVRTNLCLNSQNQLASNWLSPVYPTTGIVTASTTVDPLGGTNAFKLVYGIGPQLATIITATAGTTYTASIWVRRVTGSTQFKFIDTNNSVTLYNIDGTWQRFSLTSTASSTVGRFYVQVSDASSEIEVFGAQLEVSDFGATDYIATTSAAVSVGPVANVPRLDYLNSSCPRLLLEPQRTNLQPYSESFDNSAWTKQDSTVTANATTSPDGYQNADELKVNTTTAFHQVAAVQSVVSGTTYSYSVYAKQGSGTKFLQFAGAGLQAASQSPIFDLQNGVAYTAATKTVCLSASIQSVGNGWYRCSAVVSATGTAGLTLCFVRTTSAFSGDSFAGNGTDSFYIWGAQLEAGAYATSYIPTLGAAVTRGADAASKTGISSLIGQTEGTLFLEVDLRNFDTSADQLIAQLFQDSNNRMGLAMYRSGSTNRIQFYQIFGGNIEVNINTLASAGVFKLAGAYKNNDYVFYINGVQIGVDTTASVPTASSITLGTGNSGVAPLGNAVKELILFKTRLSNADLAALTA